MARVNLTDRRIAALQPDPSGKKRPELRDSQVPGLVLRLAAKRKTFVLHARFPGAKHPTRRALGEYGALTIEQARDLAREWQAQITRGVDPAAEKKRREDEARRAAEQQHLRQEGLFAAVAEDYLKRRVAGQRRARTVERIIRGKLVPAWGDKPITDITRRDVVRLVETINDDGAPVMAAAVFGAARALFNWAINRGAYHGFEHSPCDRVRVGDLVSRTKGVRQRVLSDDELRCLWKATGRLGYPWGPLFRFIVLTGARPAVRAGASSRTWTTQPRRCGKSRPSASSPTRRTWLRCRATRKRCWQRCRGFAVAITCSRLRSARPPRCSFTPERRGSTR